MCDRDELRTQASAAFQDVFGSDAAIATGGKPEKNARVIIATFQTLGIDREDGDASFLTENYEPGYFSHIVIDECHRSAWGKWRAVLDRNPDAVQIGLTATPRQIDVFEEGNAEIAADERLLADNFRYFGEPVYEYTVGQAIEDGYLAGCEIVRRDVFLDRKAEPEVVTGVEQDDLAGKMLSDARTGQPLFAREAAARYEATSFEKRLVLPDRVGAMCSDVFSELVETGGPEQKTIVFCSSDAHADAVARQLGILYADWCAKHGTTPAHDFAFKCTAAGGSQHLADLRGKMTSHFVACTVDLLTTGVDVPIVKNIVFMRYLRSPISFFQMVGRGTRLAPGKLMFRVYDYTDVTRLFTQDFKTRFPPVVDATPEPQDPPDRAPNILVRGFDVRVRSADEHLIVTNVGGVTAPVPVSEYKKQLAQRIRKDVKSIAELRRLWVAPKERQEFMARLPESGRCAELIRQLDGRDECDLYDVIAELTFKATPWKRIERADVFAAKNAAWIGGMPPDAGRAVHALAGQFAHGGIEALESRDVWSTSELNRLGGVKAFKGADKPAKEILSSVKKLLFAA